MIRIKIRLILIATVSLMMGAAPHASAQAPPVPGSVTASGPMESQIALSWSESGATSFNIYRGTTAGHETLYQSNVLGTTFEDAGANNAGLPNGQTYYYEVTALKGSSESAKSTEVSAVTKATPPSAMSSVVGDSQIVVSWPGTPTATGYEIYRDTLGGVGGAAYFLVNGTTSFTDKGLINGTTYYYQMSVINPSGESASETQTTSGVPKASGNPVPAAPNNVIATAGNAKIILTWLPANNATSYQIFRGTSIGQVTTSVASVTGSTYTYTNGSLTNGTTYYFLVKAVNSAGQTPSVVVNATPYIPSAPTVTATGGVGQIVVSWPAIPSSSYAIYRGVAAGAETLLDSGLTGNTYTDAGMSNGGTYYYRVALSNSGGTGPLSTEVSATASAPAPVEWDGFISFGLPGEPVQSCYSSIPDTSRPIQGALLITFQNADPFGSIYPTFPPNLTAVAQKYNLICLAPYSFNFGTPTNPLYLTTPSDNGHTIQIMDWRWPNLSGQRLQAMLTSASAMFPAHPEIQNTGIIIYGFSEGTDHANLAVSPNYNNQTGTIPSNPLSNRILAMMQLSELDEASANPLAMMDNVPHLFLSAAGSNGGNFDGSALNQELGDYPSPSTTIDGLARGEPTNQGAPLTTILDVAGGHGSNEDYPFVSLWLDSILSQRLPATLPTSTPVNLPSWQNTSSWVGTYNVSTSTSSPWGTSANPGLQMTSNLVSPRSTYADSRPFTWLPSQNMAATWLAFANSGQLTAFNPVITSPATATASVGSLFSYQITATNSPTSFAATNLPAWLKLNSTTGIISSIAGTALVPGTYTIHLSATNSQGTGATTTLTLTVNLVTTMSYSAWSGTFNFNGPETASSQNDGVSNLLKYVCDINPAIPMSAASRAALPTQGTLTVTSNGVSTTYMTLTYRLNPAITGVIVQPQSSSDLQTWLPVPVNGAATAPDYGPHLVGTDNNDQIIEVGFKLTGSSNQYIRLNVTQQ